MTTVLGIVGSARPWGNSELMARQALQGAQAEGATVHLLRLTGLHLQPCNGCMRCVLAGQACPLDDDMAWLIETIEAADGLVLAAPTYWLGPAATLKLVLDRLLMVTGQVERPLPRPRPALTVATAGLEGWRGVTLPFLNAFAHSFGFRPVDSFTAFAPGPGEVLLEENLMARALEDGRRLGRGELEPAPAPDGECPVCRCDSFILKGQRAVCPICGREATVEPGPEGLRLRFDPVVGTEHRWTPEGLRVHMIDWVQATGPRFLSRRAEIKVRRAPFREAGLEWLRPARLDQPEGGRRQGEGMPTAGAQIKEE